MVSANLVWHWLGMPEEEITANWDRDERERFQEIMENEQQRTVTNILDGIQKRAQDGDVAAVEWLEQRGFLDGDEGPRRKMVQSIYRAVTGRAEKGELDAVEWLEKHGLIELPGIPDATD